MSIFSNLFGTKKPLSVTRDAGGNWFYKMFSTSASFQKQKSTTQKINTYINNPALHKVIGLIQKVGSLSNFNLYENGKLKEKNYLYFLKKKPNPYQTWTEFVSEFLFYNSIGTAYYFKESGLNEENRNSYFLNPDNFDEKTKALFSKMGKKPTLGNKSELDNNHIVYYKYNGTDTIQLKLKQITIIHSELCLDNWFEGGSVLDSLYKIISNSESSLDAKNINLHLVQKYLLFSKSTNADHQGAITGFTDSNEKDDLKNKIYSNEKVLVSGAENIELKRFVERFKEMGFDESYLNDYLVIGLAFDIPLDLLDSWLKGKGLTSQGDSMEKSMVRFVEMVLMPKLQKLTDVLELTQNDNEEVKAEFTHLGFMRVVEKEKAEQRKLEVETLKIAFDMGLDVKDQLNTIYNGD